MMTVRGRSAGRMSWLSSSQKSPLKITIIRPLGTRWLQSSVFSRQQRAVNSCLPCPTHAPREYRGHDARVPSLHSVPARVRYPIRARRETTGPSRRHASPL